MASVSRTAAAFEARDASSLLAEAFFLLRRTPVRIFSLYYVGTLPFTLALLYYWSDMSRSAEAEGKASQGSLLLCASFIWMKCLQSAFAVELRAGMLGSRPAQWGPRAVLRLVFGQTVFHAICLPALLWALLLAFPFGWVYAFCQSGSALGDRRWRELWKESLRQSVIWPLQNHAALAYLSLWGIFVMLDIALMFIFVPQLLSSLLGWDTVLTRSGGAAYLNSTFIAAVLVLTYLCIDPLVKAFYALRCHYGLSLRSGEDMRGLLAKHKARRAASAAVLMLCLFVPLGRSEESAPLAAPEKKAASREGAALFGDNLGEALKKVFSERRYQWRMPRENTEGIEEESSVIGKIVRGVQSFAWKMLGKLRGAAEWIMENIFDRWLRQRRPEVPYSSSPGWSTLPLVLTLVTSALVILLLSAFLFYRKRSRGKKPEAAVASALPDIRSESVRPEDLESDDWARLAEELRAKGELRLAMRAYFLSCLSYLGRSGAIRTALYKSNRDYIRELCMRPAQQGARRLFPEAVAIYERAWYGYAAVDGEGLGSFIELRHGICGEDSRSTARKAPT